MDILLYVVAAILLLVVVFVGVAALKSDQMVIKRSTVMAVAPERIFPLMNSCKAFVTWSPFQKLDPNMKNEFTGPDQGVGSRMTWTGNKQAGAGSMEIRESTPCSNIKLDLHFDRPFPADNQIEYVLEKEGAGTKVTWAMYGKMNLMTKVMTMFINFDKMVGKDFDEGLAKLKALAEKA